MKFLPHLNANLWKHSNIVYLRIDFTFVQVWISSKAKFSTHFEHFNNI